MSASYIHLFYEGADRIEKYEIIDDFLEDRDFIHWKKKYVNEKALEMETILNVDYKKLFTPSIYDMKYIIHEYIDTVKILKELRGLKSKLSIKENARYKKFLKENDWNNLFKTIMKHYKVYGDVFMSYRLKLFNGLGQIPILKVIHPSKIEKVRNPETKEYEYIYKTKKVERTRVSKDSLDFQEEEVDVAILFKKGMIVPFVNSEPEIENILYMPKEVQEDPTMIHIQFLKLDNDVYSEIPALDFIDTILRLHRCETNISEINDKSGSNQLYCIDGDFDPKSTFGPRSIAYADTTAEARMKGNQCKLVQMEITNGLESLYREKDDTIEALFGSANLISPTLKKVFAKSDSSKIVKFMSMDLINEQRDAYEEICEKIKPVFKLLFPERIDEDITFDIPIDLGVNSLLDKTTYVNGNTMLIKDILREQGKTEEEIDTYMEEMNEQIQMLQGHGISAVPVVNDSMIVNQDIKPDGTTTEKRNTDPEVDKPDGVDNKDKTGR